VNCTGNFGNCYGGVHCSDQRILVYTMEADGPSWRQRLLKIGQIGQRRNLGLR
jgi:hypothetical protein